MFFQLERSCAPRDLTILLSRVRFERVGTSYRYRTGDQALFFLDTQSGGVIELELRLAVERGGRGNESGAVARGRGCFI